MRGRRRRGSELLELMLALGLASLHLSGLVAGGLARARIHHLQRGRRLAYFLARGMACELPLSRRPRARGPVPLTALAGVGRDRRRLGLEPRLLRWLDSLQVVISPRGGEVTLRILGPGVREERRLGRDSWRRSS